MSIESEEPNVNPPGITITRKDLLRYISGIGAGIGTGALLLPTSYAVLVATEAVTGQKSGNSLIDKDMEKACKGAKDKELCEYEFIQDDARRYAEDTIITAPIIEEGIFRALPSYFIKDRKAGIGLSRKELIAGGITSLLFGYTHNLLAWDARRIPSPQIAGGMSFWYLQRKFGYLSSVVAHATLNASAITIITHVPPPKR